MVNNIKKPIFTDYIKGYDTSTPEAEYVYNSQLENYCNAIDKYCDELENNNLEIKQAYELACGQLNYFQTKLLDLEKQITHIVRKYGCRDGIYPISGEKWQKTLLDAVKKHNEREDN